MQCDIDIEVFLSRVSEGKFKFYMTPTAFKELGGEARDDSQILLQISSDEIGDILDGVLSDVIGRYVVPDFAPTRVTNLNVESIDENQFFATFAYRNKTYYMDCIQQVFTICLLEEH